VPESPAAFPIRSSVADGLLRDRGASAGGPSTVSRKLFRSSPSIRETKTRFEGSTEVEGRALIHGSCGACQPTGRPRSPFSLPLFVSPSP
jgi:hypothetical protein